MSFDFDEITKLAQKYVATRPVIIIGSGASAPYGIPLMSELAQKLLDNIDLDDDPWKEFKERLIATSDLELALQEVNLPQGHVDTIINETWEVINTADVEFFVNALQTRSPIALSRLISYLLRTANPQLDIITTNYDRVIEYAASFARAQVVTGFTAGWVKRFISNRLESTDFKKNPSYRGRIKLLKVHGSLDWFLDPDQEPIAITNARKIPDNYTPLIVAPGVTKFRTVLTKPPYFTILTQIESVLSEANSYLSIGYGFNDEHIQPTLIRRVKKDGIPIIILTKTVSNAARQVFLLDAPAKFLIFENHPKGTMIYSPEFIAGHLVPDKDYWKLDEFITLISTEGKTL